VTSPPTAAVEEVRAALAEGLAAFQARDLPGAHRAFERAHRRDPRDPHAMSWYGVTLVLVERNLSLGVSLCDQALRAALDPDLLLNLARVHLALAHRERAVRAVQRGLEAAPGHPGLQAALAALGTRREPVLPLLGRANPLNRLLGRLRARWSSRRGPAYELSPVALGSPPAAPAPAQPPAPPEP
jgi:tetratricopeptide (TPR) repeat protein